MPLIQLPYDTCKELLRGYGELKERDSCWQRRVVSLNAHVFILANKATSRVGLRELEDLFALLH